MNPSSNATIMNIFPNPIPHLGPDKNINILMYTSPLIHCLSLSWYVF